MLRIVISIFIILHGLVHLFYFAHSRRIFEIQDDLPWPDESWAFSKWLGEHTTQQLASITYLLSALGFLVGGAGALLSQSWAGPTLQATAIFSSVFIILFWDGKPQKLANQGWIGLLINVGIFLGILFTE